MQYPAKRSPEELIGSFDWKKAFFSKMGDVRKGECVPKREERSENGNHDVNDNFEHLRMFEAKLMG